MLTVQFITYKYFKLKLKIVTITSYFRRTVMGCVKLTNWTHDSFTRYGRNSSDNACPLLFTTLVFPTTLRNKFLLFSYNALLVLPSLFPKYYVTINSTDISSCWVLVPIMVMIRVSGSADYWHFLRFRLECLIKGCHSYCERTCVL